MTREREYFFGEDRMRGGFGGRGGGRGDAAGGRGSFVHKSQIVKALKETMQSGHKTGLPSKILDYFTPRPPLKPGTEIKRRKKKVPFTGVAAYVHMFAGPQDPEEIKEPSNKLRLFKNPELQLQCRLNTETRSEKVIRLTEWKKEEAASSAAEAAKAWDPHKDPKIEGDPFRTLFVARLSYEVNEKKLKREFEEFGPIKQVRIITDKTGKSRGYAFVEFEDKKDMKEAYKAADSRKIEGRRVLVDVERGRTVDSWKPRRLAGGLGAEGRAPRAPKPKNVKGPLGMAPHMMDDRRGPPRDRSPPRPIDRERLDRERAERERRVREDSERDRKRDREVSPPRRDRERDDPSKRRREGDEGDLGRDRDRGRDRSPDRRRRV